jgi:hypothetical protein
VGDEEQRRSHAGHWVGSERPRHEVAPIVVERWCYLPEEEEMGACGCCEPTTGAQSWSAVGLKAMMQSEGSNGREAEVAVDSASAVSSTALGRLIPDVRRSKLETRKFSGQANRTVSVGPQIDCRHCLGRHTIMNS